MSPHDVTPAVWQVMAAQADDLFALYQLAQMLAEARDLDELIGLALPHLARVSDSAYAALLLPIDPHTQLNLVGWIGPDFDEYRNPDADPQFPQVQVALDWFLDTLDLQPSACLNLQLEVGRAMPGLLLLAAPSQHGFSRHQQHLMATMARELARALELALARTELERRQQRIEQMQVDFVATVSHELRAPLARMQGYVDSLTHLRLTQEQQRRFIAEIGTAIAQLSRMVDTILDFSRADAGQQPLKRSVVDLCDLVERAVRELEPLTQARVQHDVPPIAVRADPARLSQVLSNVLSNALKYSPPDTPVVVRARSHTSRGYACLVVGDRGRGVPPDDQPYLFSRFFRARNVRESSAMGIGLGLYLCKHSIELQGGTIRLRSRLGRGTVVRVGIPLAYS